MLIRRFVTQSFVLFIIITLVVGGLVSLAISKYLTSYFVAQTTAIVHFMGKDHLSEIKDWNVPVRETEELNKMVKHLNELAGTGLESPMIPSKVARLNLFNPNRTVIWSTENSAIGKLFHDYPNLIAAISGTVRSQWGLYEGTEKAQTEVIEIYVPYRNSTTDKILGVVEIYWDASNLKVLIRKAQTATVTVIIVFFSLMYGLIYRLVGGASNLFDQRSAELVKSQESQEKAYLDIIKSLAAAIDAKDPYTMGHSGRVARNAVMLAGALHLPKEEQKVVEQAAILHDVGKIGIKDSILNKPNALTLEEWEEMKAHPEIGALIIASSESFDPKVLMIIKHHHERYDGRGYPSGLLNGDIPLGARIIALADSYDAMRSDRPYRRARSPQEALDEVNRGAGTQFDPLVVKAFLRVRDTIESLYNLEEGHSRSTA